MKVLVQGKQTGVELLHSLDGLPDLAGHDQPLDVLPVPHAGQLSAHLGLLTHTSGKTLCRAAVAVVDEVGEDCVVEHRLLVTLLPRPAELLNCCLSSSPQLPHLSLDIKFERFLPKVGEEVEWEDACAVESAKLQQYTFDMLDHYKNHNF